MEWKKRAMAVTVAETKKVLSRKRRKSSLVKTVRELSRGEWPGTRLMLKTSSGRLKTIDSIPRSGTTVMTARTALTRKRTIRVGFNARRPSKVVPVVVSAASAIDEAAAAGEEEEKHGHRHQDEDKDGGHGRGVTEVVILEGLLVDVIDGKLGRVRRPALRHDVDEVE